MLGAIVNIPAGGQKVKGLQDAKEPKKETELIEIDLQ